MTNADRALFLRVQARVRQLQPTLAKALLDSLERLRTALPVDDLRALMRGLSTADAITPEMIAQVLGDSLFSESFAPYRDALRDAIRDAAGLSMRDIPGVPGRASVGVLFDSLSPNVITAVRALETSALDTLKADVREITRAYVENGLRDGVPPQDVARSLRSAIGLSPTQSSYVDNLEKELRELDPAALQRVLRDRRYDKMIREAVKTGTPLSEERISTIVGAYRRRWIATNTEWNTRQATFDAYRSGNRLAWEGAQDAGYVEGVTKTWVHFDAQPDPRPEHVELSGETVPVDQAYSTGQMTAGEGDYNCKCTDRYGAAGATPAANARTGTRALSGFVNL